jgi:hypothetical protein
MMLGSHRLSVVFDVAQRWMVEGFDFDPDSAPWCCGTDTAVKEQKTMKMQGSMK